MNNSLKNIISNTNIVKEKYNILTFPTHERYQEQLCKTGHNFYSFSIDSEKQWDYEQCKPPENYYIMQRNNVAVGLNFDFILVQSKFWQYQIAKRITETINIPILVLEHTVPIGEERSAIFSSMTGDINVFITKHSLDQHNLPTELDVRVIRHGIDTNKFNRSDEEKDNKILTVANDFRNRPELNYDGWQRITKGFDVELMGNNQELSSLASSTDELVSKYNKAAVYLNTTTHSPVPMSLLEAMSCGCAIVTTATCEIPNIIENGINGFMSNDEEELKSYIKNLLADKELREKIGSKARQTILEHFSEDAFIKNWNKTFNDIMRKI